MADVYSERFLLAQKPGTPLVAYTVPPGRRAILRSLTFSGYVTVSPVVWLRIAGVYIFALIPPGATFGGNTELYQVVYENEVMTLECTAQSGDMGASVSGYLLTDYAGREAGAGQLPALPDPHPPLEPDY